VWKPHTPRRTLARNTVYIHEVDYCKHILLAELTAILKIVHDMELDPGPPQIFTDS
jgi:hypothetical protein